MKVGYARVSTQDQNPQLQLDALTAAGCERIFTDKRSGTDRERPQLRLAIKFCKKGDTLVCWKLDRVARSLAHLLKIAEDLDLEHVAFRSLTENIDTSSASGRMLMHILGALAEFERSLIRERTMAGLAAARAKGRVGGRKSPITIEHIRQARQARNRGMQSEAIYAALGVSRAAYYRAVARYKTMQ